MKKIASFIVLTMLSSSAFAQDFFVKAGAGAGKSSSAFQVFSGGAYDNKMNIPSTQAQLSVGFTMGNMQLETGVGYLGTGVTFSETYGVAICGAPVPEQNGTPVPQNLPAVKYTIKNDHIVMPLIMSYAMNKKSKLSFYPGVGIEAAYNFQGKISANRDAGQEVKMYYEYNPISALVLFKFDVQYRINKQLSVWVSPAYEHMVTSLTKKVGGDNMSRRYDHAMLFNVGVKYDLHCSFHCPFHCAKTEAKI